MIKFSKMHKKIIKYHPKIIKYNQMHKKMIKYNPKGERFI